MDKYEKIRFLKQQKQDIFKRLGEVINTNEYKKVRKQLKTLDELIKNEK